MKTIGNDKLLKQMAAVLQKASQAQEWEDDMDPSLQDFYRKAIMAITEIDQLLKKFKERTVNLPNLWEILNIWEMASRHINIKEINLKICGRGYDMYGGTYFQSIDELKSAIAQYDPKNRVNEMLATDPHNLEIKFE